MKTTINTNTRKEKTLEVKFSNMTFVVKAYSHFMRELNSPYWVKNRFSATIKETGENIGFIGCRKNLKAQMELVNSKPHLFLR